MVLFDAIAGQWPGSGFFTTRMKAETLYEAQNSRIAEPMTDWPGVKAGAAVAVSHSTNKAQCKSYGARWNDMRQRVPRL